jgi:glycerol-3-phosphate dehydrogenase
MKSTNESKASFSVQTRNQNIAKFKKEHFYDLVIIGGGITGAGLAREAASRGMSVALVEKDDFSSGTSSRSSKLIHGGIRYLENLEFHLVFEALSERATLFKMAPHLVHPLRFLLPLYKGGRVGMIKMGLGMWLYDLLSLFEAPEMHERLSVDESVERIPSLNTKNLLGSYEYSDAYMDDDRLVHETLRSAHRWGAHCANFVTAIGAELKKGNVVGLKCKDLIHQDEFVIRGQHFVSTVGPWTDLLGSQLFGQWKKMMRPSKGIHLTLSQEDLPLSRAVVMASDKDKRIIFGIPRHEMVIIGTTDTDFKGSPEDVHSTREDVDYLLKVIDEYFPGAHLTRDKIIASYAGVRPLVHDGSQTESATSREHVIINDPRNVTFVAGGKYTTYRSMAEETLESILNNYTIEKQVQFTASNTKQALNPLITPEKYAYAKTQIQKWAKEFELSEAEMSRLVDRHGLEATELLLHLPETKVSISKFWQVEVHHAIENTMCLRLKDFYLRRTPLFLSEPDNGQQWVHLIADLFAEKLLWSEAVKAQNIQQLKDHFQLELGWKK